MTEKELLELWAKDEAEMLQRVRGIETKTDRIAIIWCPTWMLNGSCQYPGMIAIYDIKKDKFISLNSGGPRVFLL